MILSLVAALSNPLAFLHGRPHDVQTTSTKVQGWRITARHDRFLNTTSCRLHRGSMTLERGVMVFQFPHSVDTARAEFKIDGGPAQGVGTVAMEVAGQGVALNGDSLRYPGEGRVALPARILQTARVVAIQPNARRNHRDFDLSGLSAAVEASQHQGCPVPAAPVATS